MNCAVWAKCVSRIAYMTVRVKRLIIFRVIWGSYVKQMFLDTAFRVQCLRQRTLLISITYTMAQSTRTCVSSADIVIEEETRRMSENISLPVEKYKAVLYATGGTWNYVWMGMQDRLFFGNHAGESCRKPCSTVYKILKVYHWIYKSDKKCDIVLDWLNIFFVP